MSVTARPLQPEDLTRLFVERANAGDAAGIAALYEEQAVMAYPPGEVTVGRDAIRALWEKVLVNAPQFTPESPLPTLVSGDIALTSTRRETVRARGHKWFAGSPMAPGCDCSISLNSSAPPSTRSKAGSGDKCHLHGPCWRPSTTASHGPADGQCDGCVRSAGSNAGGCST
jgi:hypothetical protein